ncbi:hypothetical protein JL09_g3591 [Pichia kudriavzevii]|uniref:Matrin-type domain-containing protein n=1 Tax=Pichia kudriavzevii TaxID=4909 RepID=A0A099NZD8_PICKU|nr:hypothetical protein JL09_g3591 [Pichia kudriavzevii]
MPYYCPYCKTSLTHDSFSVRKSHRHGQKHVRLREEYYQRVIAEHPESVTLEQELASVNPLERIFAGMPGSQKQYFEQNPQKRVLTVPPTSASLPAPPPYVYFTLDAVAVPEKRVNIERRDDEGHGHGYGFGRRGYRGRGGSHGQGRGHLRGRGRGSGRGSGSDGGRGGRGGRGYGGSYGGSYGGGEGNGRPYSSHGTGYNNGNANANYGYHSHSRSYHDQGQRRGDATFGR